MADSNEATEAELAKKPVVDRVTLDRSEAEKIQSWLQQLHDGSKGFLQLTKTDVVNFLIRQHQPELSKKEMQQIRQDHYDPIKHLMWITPKLKAAIASSDIEMVTALQDEIRGIELPVVSDAKEKIGAIASTEAPPVGRAKSKKHSEKDDVPLVRTGANSEPETQF